MKISIVTISFNQAKFLPDAIESVLQQDHPEFEYIIVDPGSTDDSRNIIESYRGKIDHIILDPDAGPADGLNKGFAAATGDVFGFINSDDFLLPDALSEVAKYFRENPDVAVVSGNAFVVNANGKQTNRFHSRKFSLWMCAYGAATLAQQSTFFKADAFRAVGGFNSDNRVAWDGELWIDMALAGAKFGRTPKFLSGFRLYEDTITGSGKFRKAYDDYIKAMFFKIMGRHWKRSDSLTRWFAKGYEYLSQPVIFRDRILRGPAVPSASVND
jgi:glycosyltransferase involved in cell wall biosynthesis